MNIDQNNNKSYMLQVNEIIDSICKMSYHSIQSQLQTCHHIVRQLLRDDLVFHFKSQNAIKLLAYELILVLAEEESIGKRPKIEKQEQKLVENKKIKLTVSMKNVLFTIRSLLEEMIWKNKRRNLKDQKIQQYFNQFSNLLSEFSKKLNFSPDDDGHENELMIQQLESIIVKKQKRIKELNEEMQQSIIEQKEIQDLNDQLELRNEELSREVEELKNKLKEADVQILLLEDKMEDLQNDSKIFKIERKKQTKDSLKFEEFEETQLISKSLHMDEKKEGQKELTGVEEMHRMLLIQSLSIEAMI